MTKLANLIARFRRYLRYSNNKGLRYRTTVQAYWVQHDPKGLGEW